MGGQLSSWSEYWAPEELLVEQELPVKLPQLGNEGRGRHTLHKRTGGGGDFEMPPEELIKPMLDGLMSVGYSERVARCVVVRLKLTSALRCKIPQILEAA